LGWLASPHGPFVHGPFVFDVATALIQKKFPALTTPQAHQLIADAISDECESLHDFVPIINYHQHRNFAAANSHRKSRKVAQAMIPKHPSLNQAESLNR